jgi:hypothetical protein
MGFERQKVKVRAKQRDSAMPKGTKILITMVTEKVRHSVTARLMGLGMGTGMH